MSKDKNPKKNARREAQQRRRLPPGSSCSLCGESTPYLLEAHHPVGKAHEPDLTITLCKNHHLKATEGQLREEVPLSATDNFLDRVAAIFGALAAFFRFLAEAFDRLVEQAKTFARRLDAEFPEWRAELGEGA